MDYRLQVFKLEAKDGNLSSTYRFAVLDLSRSKSYPENFVCMLPAKVSQDKGKIANVFGTLFGDESVDFAIGLLDQALKNESDAEVKAEIERRLKLIRAKEYGLVICSGCHKAFQPVKVRKYKQYFCRECYRKKYGARQ